MSPKPMRTSKLPLRRAVALACAALVVAIAAASGTAASATDKVAPSGSAAASAGSNAPAASESATANPSTPASPSPTVAPTPSDSALQLPSGQLQGVDLSRYQSQVRKVSVDFKALAAEGQQFMIARVGSSEGCPPRRVIVQRNDSAYAQHVYAARAAGLKVGHYWFNGQGTPTADAAYFVSQLRGYKSGDPVVLDIEPHYSWHWNADKNKYVCKHQNTWSQVDALKWVSQVRSALPNANVFVYMGRHTLNSQNWTVLALTTKLWYASYGNNTGQPGDEPEVKYWPTWTIWQYTNKGALAAVTGKHPEVDRNIAKSNAWN